MAKNAENISEVVLKLAAIVGGAWLAAEIIKAFAKEETVYSCPRCGTDIKFGETPCHNCHTELSWPSNATEQQINS